MYYSYGIYSFKVNNGNNRRVCETCLKLTIKAPERSQRRLDLNFSIFKKDVYCFRYAIYALFHFRPFEWPKPSVINSNVIKYNVI